MNRVPMAYLDIGYLKSEYPKCNLTDYFSLLQCKKTNTFARSLNFLLDLIQNDRPVRFHGFDSFHSTGASVLDCLVDGTIEYYDGVLVVTEERQKNISFSTPFSFDRSCFYLHPTHFLSIKARAFYFLEPFSRGVWLMVGAAVVFCCLFIIIQNLLETERLSSRCSLLSQLKILSRLRNRYDVSVGLLITVFTVVYNTKMRSDFVEHSYVQTPFDTLNQLADLIKKKSLRLQVEQLDDFRNEFLDNPKSSDFKKLVDALQLNPPKIVGDPQTACESLLNIPDAVLFQSHLNALYTCSLETFSDLIEICPNGGPFVMGSFGFRKGSKLVETFSRVAPFIHGFEQRYNSKLKNGANFHLPFELKVEAKTAVPVNTVAFVFGILFVGYVLGGWILFGEVAVSKARTGSFDISPSIA